MIWDGTSWSLSTHLFMSIHTVLRVNFDYPLTSPVHHPSRASISALASKSLSSLACFNLVYLVLQLLSHLIFRSRSNLGSGILSFGPYVASLGGTWRELADLGSSVMRAPGLAPNSELIDRIVVIPPQRAHVGRPSFRGQFLLAWCNAYPLTN
ncbi:hypothetical protein BGW80DRAFT_760528 [Lactifluus volemus]|nr:hypothetical protein BGW80DRAFT_760528 [Lactifluus volemus]